MRVLLLDVNCKYSSTGKIVYDLYRQLKEDGHEAGIAYGRGPLVDEENIYRFSPQWEVYMHALLTRITGYTSCFSYFATKRLIKFIENFQPDVIHLHDMHGYFVNIIPLIDYLKKKKTKTVWTFHCEFMYTGKCGHAYECNKWQDRCEKCPHLRDYPQSVFFDKTRTMYEKKKKAFEGFDDLIIVSPSEWLGDRIKQSFLKNKRVEIINNGIDTHIFHVCDADALKKKHGLEGEKIVLAVAPNLMSDNKGGAHVLKMAEQFKGENVKFVLVGLDEPETVKGENIISLGRIKDQSELAKYYSMADVFLICSKRENFPTTCIEALCCGTPVVGYNTGGTAETAKGEVGKFVEYGDVLGAATAIREFLKQNREENIKKCSAYGKERYSKKYMYEKYLALYK